MSTLSDLESQAVKEGIEIDSPANAPAESTPAPKVAEEAAPAPASPSKDSQVPSPVKTGLESEDNVPFHKHPRFQKLVKENKDWADKYTSIESKLKAQEDYLRQLQSLNQPRSQEMPDEQRQAIIQLARLFKQSPEFQQELGLNKIGELERMNQELVAQRSEEAFNKEMTEVMDYAVSLGMDKDETGEELAELISNHPVYSKVPYSPGLIRTIFRDAKWDKMGELKEMEINSRLIKEQEAKRKTNSESTSPNSDKPVRKLAPSMEQHLADRIKEEGGLIV